MRFRPILVSIFLTFVSGCGESSSTSSVTGGAALAGHWRFTETLNGGGFSLVTDTNIVLNADGTCTTWTRNERGTGDAETTGQWKTDGGHLYMRPPGDGAWNDAGTVTLDGDRLRIVLPNGDTQVFQRQ